MSTSDNTVRDAIRQTAAGPASVSIDGTATVSQRVADQIAADQYLDPRRTRDRNHCGLTFRKIVAPGAG